MGNGAQQMSLCTMHGENGWWTGEGGSYLQHSGDTGLVKAV